MAENLLCHPHEFRGGRKDMIFPGRRKKERSKMLTVNPQKIGLRLCYQIF